MDEDPIGTLIDRVAEAVVRKIEEQQKIEAIAQAVLDRLPKASTTRTPRKPARNPSASKSPTQTTRTELGSPSTRTGRAIKPSTKSRARNTTTVSTTRARRGAR